MKSVSLSLIISTYEQPDSLAKVLRGVALQTRRPDEVFITDDGSGMPTRGVIDAWKRQAPYPCQQLWHVHEGFRKTTLLNRAVAMASGNYLVFLDGDCVPHRKFLADHERLAEPGYWVQGRRCFVREPFVTEFEAGETPIWRWALSGRITQGQKGFYLPWPLIFRNRRQRGILGCNMAFWRDDVVAVNGFDETYVGRGIGPDSDLGTRVYNLGRRRKFVYGRALVYHLNHPVMPRDNLEAKRTWLEQTIHSGKTRCEQGMEQYT